MAGDWIKVEKVTPDKPELAILARKLKVSQGEAFAEWFCIYAWADGVTVDGFVPHLSLSDGDALSRSRPGTCAALASPEIGWVVEEADGLHFLKWERHNGKCAKARALDTEKKRRQRAQAPDMSRSCPDADGTDPGTREEKRRTTPHSPPQGEKNDYPEDFAQFWNAYPRKRGKGAAFKAWRKAKGKPDAAKLVQIVEHYALSPDWSREEGRFIPYPATWLNERRWEDEIPTNDQPHKAFDSENQEIERKRQEGLA